MRKHISIALSDRWAIIGATGAGKTVFSKRLLHAYARGTQGLIPIYILDTKGFSAAKRGKDDFKEFRRKGIGRLVAGQEPPVPKLPKPESGPFIVWQPEEDDPAIYDKFFHDIYKAGLPAVVYVDELSSIQEGRKAPRHFGILQKQGRGLDIALITVTQSPSYLDENILRQTSHLLRMRLNDDYDIQKIAKRSGSAMMEDPVDDFGFWYRDVRKPVAKNPPTYYKDLKEFFGDE